MEPFLVDAPWLKSESTLIPEAMRHFYLAEAYEASVWHSRALSEIDRAIQLDPANPDFYILKTKILLEQEKSAEAAKAALLALERSPKTIRPILGLSDDFYLTEAKIVYSKIIAMGSKEILPYLGLGNIALHYGEIKEAEKWFDQAKRINGEHAGVLLARGRLTLAKGDAATARELLEQSKEKGEDSATLFGALGDAYFHLELWDQAAKSYGQAVKLRRRNTDWRRSMGIALAKMGKVEEAEEKFREVLALNSDDASAWQELHKLGKKY
jgi:tetratricopeptide (TPR) repeat protein